MFSFFKKKEAPKITISCKTDEVTINDKKVDFPSNYKKLIEVLGEPTREIEKNKYYIFWDSIGVFCGFTDKNNILSISVHQIKKSKSEYDTKEQFIGKLFLNDEDITNNEFSKISLGSIVIHRLGGEKEIRYGFSISTNNTI